MNLFIVGVHRFRSSGFKGFGLQSSPLLLGLQLHWARMKLHVKITANRRITNIEPQNVGCRMTKDGIVSRNLILNTDFRRALNVTEI